MLKKLLLSSALLLSGCAARVVTVDRPVTPAPCHLPPFPDFPDVNPVALADPATSPDGTGVGGATAYVVMTAPDFSVLAEWVLEVAEWKEAVATCPLVKINTSNPTPLSTTPAPVGK